MGAATIGEVAELGLSIEELRQYNAALRLRIDELEGRIIELKLAAEDNLRKINLERAPRESHDMSKAVG